MKSQQDGTFFAQKLQRGPTTWKDTLRPRIGMTMFLGQVDHCKGGVGLHSATSGRPTLVRDGNSSQLHQVSLPTLSTGPGRLHFEFEFFGVWLESSNSLRATFSIHSSSKKQLLPHIAKSDACHCAREKCSNCKEYLSGMLDSEHYFRIFSEQKAIFHGIAAPCTSQRSLQPSASHAFSAMFTFFWRGPTPRSSIFVRKASRAD